jgi:cytochrome c556
MRRSRVYVSVALTAALGGSLATAGLMRAQDDRREPIVVTAMQRDHMLAEMRGLLGAVNGVLRGVASNDTALMRASAAAAGMAAMRAQMGGRGIGGGMGPGAAMRDSMMRGDTTMRGMGPGRGMGMGMGARRPEAFRRLGMGTHEAFDSLATAIAAGTPRDTVIGRIATITSNCVSCHWMYRLEVR